MKVFYFTQTNSGDIHRDTQKNTYRQTHSDSGGYRKRCSSVRAYAPARSSKFAPGLPVKTGASGGVININQRIRQRPQPSLKCTHCLAPTTPYGYRAANNNDVPPGFPAVYLSSVPRGSCFPRPSHDLHGSTRVGSVPNRTVAGLPITRPDAPPLAHRGASLRDVLYCAPLLSTTNAAL